MTQSVSPQEAARQSKLVVWSPIYYGWVILAAAAIGSIMSSPGQTYSVSIFIEHFIADLGISRSLVSTLYTMGTLTASFALPYIGRQIDRRGPRFMVGVIAACFALACAYMGLVQNAVMLGVGFVLIRMLGQGSLSLVSSNVINRWWVRRRGTVLGIAGVLVTLLGSGTFPSLVHALIGQFGWRSSYALLGALVAGVMLPVGLVFFRRQPEDFGLLPDGAKALSEGDAQDALASVEENWTREEAIRTSAFWIISLAGATLSMLGTGLHFHMVSIISDAGLSAAAAAAAFMPISLTGALVRVASGVLVDRIAVRFLLSGALVGQAISLLMAPRLQGTTMALIYGVVLGITGSLQMTVSNVVWAKYFGRRHLGSVTGVAFLVSIAGSALGPMPMGIARDVFGSYNLALTVAAALPLALAVVALFARRPQKAV
jgi:sugar phosphate permease